MVQNNPNIPPSTPNSTSFKYNPIFEKLVVNQERDSVERLIGMLAYAEYKLDKHEWMKQNPNASQQLLDAFLSHYSDRVLDKYRDEAQNTLYVYGEEYSQYQLKDKLLAYKEEAVMTQVKGTEKNLTEAIEKRTSLKGAIWAGLWSSTIFTFLLFLIALLIRFGAPDSSIGKLIQYLTSPAEYQLELKKINNNSK